MRARREVVIAAVLVGIGLIALAAGLASDDGDEPATSPQPTTPPLVVVEEDGAQRAVPADRLTATYCRRRPRVCASVAAEDRRTLPPASQRAVERARERVLAARRAARRERARERRERERERAERAEDDGLPTTP